MVQIIPCRFATQDDGLEEEVVFFLGKRRQVDVVVRSNDQNSLSGILHLVRMGQDIEQTAGFDRYHDMLLIAALAAFLLWCIGIAGKNQPIAKQVRVNSSSKRDPYSVIFLARLLLRQPAFRLLPNQIWQSLTTINPYIESLLDA